MSQRSAENEAAGLNPDNGVDPLLPVQLCKRMNNIPEKFRIGRNGHNVPENDTFCRIIGNADYPVCNTFTQLFHCLSLRLKISFKS